jgi:hypothetical protein
VKRQRLLELIGALLLIHQSNASKHEIPERQKRKLERLLIRLTNAGRFTGRRDQPS